MNKAKKQGVTPKQTSLNVVIQDMAKNKEPKMKKLKNNPTKIVLPEGSIFTYNSEEIAYFSAERQSILIKQSVDTNPLVFTFNEEKNYQQAVKKMRQIFSPDHYLHCPHGVVAYSAIQSISLIPNHCILIAKDDIEHAMMNISLDGQNYETQRQTLEEVCQFAKGDKRFAYIEGVGLIKKNMVHNVLTRETGALLLNKRNQAVLWVTYTPETRDEVLPNLYQTLGLTSEVSVEETA